MDICFALLRHGRLVLHSSSILVNGKVILFAAPSGTGKSTQAALWEKYRCAEVLNGDKNCVSFDENSGTAIAHGLPFCGTSGGLPTIFPVRSSAIVLLKQAPENKIRRLRGITGSLRTVRKLHGSQIRPRNHAPDVGCASKGAARRAGVRAVVYSR